MRFVLRNGDLSCNSQKDAESCVSKRMGLRWLVFPILCLFSNCSASFGGYIWLYTIHMEYMELQIAVQLPSSGDAHPFGS